MSDVYLIVNNSHLRVKYDNGWGTYNNVGHWWGKELAFQKCLVPSKWNLRFGSTIDNSTSIIGLC